MNQNYPKYVIKKLRVYNGLDEEDTGKDAEFQEMEPEDVLDQVLRFDGFVGYRFTILRWIADIFKVKLDIEGDKQSRKDFVHGLGNIFRAQERADEVVAMRMDDDEIVTIHFKKGTTRQADLGSKAAMVSDITKRVF